MSLNDFTLQKKKDSWVNQNQSKNIFTENQSTIEYVNNLLTTSQQFDWVSVYGSQLVSHGKKYTWTISIRDYPQLQNNNDWIVLIGFAPQKINLENYFSFGNNGIAWVGGSVVDNSRQKSILYHGQSSYPYGLTLKKDDILQLNVDFTGEEGGLIEFKLQINGVFQSFGQAPVMLKNNTSYYLALSTSRNNTKIQITDFHLGIPLDIFNSITITNVEYSKNFLTASSIQSPNSNIWHTVYNTQKIENLIHYQWKLRIIDLPQLSQIIIGIVNDPEFTNKNQPLTNGNLGVGLLNNGNKKTAISELSYLDQILTVGDIITMEFMDNKLFFYVNGNKISDTPAFSEITIGPDDNYSLGLSFQGQASVEIIDWDLVYFTDVTQRSDWIQELDSYRITQNNVLQYGYSLVLKNIGEVNKTLYGIIGSPQIDDPKGGGLIDILKLDTTRQWTADISNVRIPENFGVFREHIFPVQKTITGNDIIVFDRNSTLIARNKDQFGSALAIDLSGQVIVGAPQGSQNNYQSGSVYLYDLEQEKWNF